MKKSMLITGIMVAIFSSFIFSAQSQDSKAVQFLNSKSASKLNLPFSEAVKVGRTLYLSGQLGNIPGTKKLVPGGIEAEARQTMDNIRNTLIAHGYAMKDIVKCTVMLADIAEWQSFNKVYASYFSKPFPARSAFGANGLALNAKVEVECIAAK